MSNRFAKLTGQFFIARAECRPAITPVVAVPIVHAGYFEAAPPGYPLQCTRRIHIPQCKAELLANDGVTVPACISNGVAASRCNI